MMKLGDKAGGKQDQEGVDALVYIQLLIRFVLFGGVTFLFVYFGADSVRAIINALPPKLIIWIWNCWRNDASNRVLPYY